MRARLLWLSLGALSLGVARLTGAVIGQVLFNRSMIYPKEQ